MFKILEGDYESFGFGHNIQIKGGQSKWHVFNRTFNQLNTFEYIHLNDIAAEEKYCIYLHIGFDFERSNNHYDWMYGSSIGESKVEKTKMEYFPVPVRIWNDSANGKVHWIINWPSEAFMNDSIDFDLLLKGLNCQDYPQNLTFATGSEVGVPGVDNRSATFLEQTYNINVINGSDLFYYCYRDINDPAVQEFISKKSIHTVNKKINSYLSICYNRTPKLHRAIIIAHLQYKHHNHLSIHSYAEPNRTHPPLDAFANQNPFEYLRPQFESLLSRDSPLKTQFAEDDINLGQNQADTLNFEHALHSNFHIVTETMPPVTEVAEFRRTFITEKSYKPFYMMQPFIICGNKHTIKSLKHLGYETFDKWIDHSYDEVDDYCNRLQIFLVELDRLHNIPPEEWAEMLYDMIPGLLQNIHLVTRHEFKSSTADLSTILLRFFYT